MYGGKEGKNMKRKIKYENAPAEISDAIENSIIIDDFLPPPEKLVLKNKVQKVTINLSEKSVAFFKVKAKKMNVSYQLMIKELLDKYADYYSMKKI